MKHEGMTRMGTDKEKEIREMREIRG